jgi:hypothetical protein
MRKIISIATIVPFFHLSSAFCYNHTLLEFNADSFNECIWSNTSVPTKRIQESLDFLDPETDDKYSKEYSGKNIFNEYEEKINQASNSALKTFFANCKELFNFYEDIDSFTQVAVQILFERVFQKYEDRANTVFSTKHLLPIIEKVDEDEVHPQKRATVQALVEEFPLEYQPKLHMLILGIAYSFFPEVFEQKLTLDDVSSKCGLPLDELKRNYEHYLQQVK